MKIIVPMAGMGKRMRPHTLTVPKPLIPVAGKPIVQRLMEDIAEMAGEEIEEIAFIIGDFGKEVEANLITIAENLGARGTIHYQEEALGTAHAIMCAESALEGKVIVAFADTLFQAEFTLDNSYDGIIWVQKVEDPSAFGVVKLNDDGSIADFVEKPETFVSDLAIIGVYYFRDGERLKQEIQYLLDNNVMDKGEYQLTDALKNMNSAGLNLFPGEVQEWLDCGNKNATVYTNKRILEIKENESLISERIEMDNGTIHEPCYIGEGVKITNSEIGPHVSIGANSVISDSRITNSIIQTNTSVENSTVGNSMIGNFVQITGAVGEFSIGDYSTYHKTD